MHVELRSITPEAESLIARCARVSHRSVGKGVEGDRRLIRKLIALGHESVLEHAVATFEISGISRACANQLTRHRLASFIQEPNATWTPAPWTWSVLLPLPRRTGAKLRPFYKKPKSYTGPSWKRACPKRTRVLCSP